MTELEPRRVEYLPVAELSANPRNPKAHSGEVIDDSIGRFGMLDPIVRDERTGYIISGHGRRQALADREARGETPPEGVKVADDGSWLVPVVVGWASRSDTEASAALIALNRTTELGGWVDEELLGLLNDLSEAGGDDAFEGVGFDEFDLDDLRHRLSEIDKEGTPDTGDEWDYSGTGKQLSIDELAELYGDRSVRRMMMEFNREEYVLVVARMRAAREAFGVEDNPAALSALLEERFPEVEATQEDEHAAEAEDREASSADEHRDPAATVGEE